MAGAGLLLLFFPAGAAHAHAVEAFGGFHTNFDGDHRRKYGGAVSWGAAYPITLGIRTNLVGERHRGPVGLYFGIGVTSALSGIKESWGERSSSPTFGAVCELRPQVRVSKGVSLWARERITVLADAEYDRRTINHSGASLQLGFSVGAP